MITEPVMVTVFCAQGEHRLSPLRLAFMMDPSLLLRVLLAFRQHQQNQSKINSSATAAELIIVLLYEATNDLSSSSTLQSFYDHESARNQQSRALSPRTPPASSIKVDDGAVEERSF